VVNGIPVATAELKNPLTGQTIEHAMAQYRTDRNPHDLIFRSRTLVHFAVDPHRVAMTTRLAGQDTVFLPFDQGSGGAGNTGARETRRDRRLPDGIPLGAGVATRRVAGPARVVHPRRGRPGALPAVPPVARGALDPRGTYADGAGVDRLVQHSAGSGKSNTIAWTAHALSRLHGPMTQPIFDKVVVITDRKVLDRQLQDTVAGLEHTPGTIVRIDEDSAQLKEALEGHAARVIITTLQKFPVVAALPAKEAADGG
jgi:type I restriction enzyme R subunit